MRTFGPTWEAEAPLRRSPEKREAPIMGTAICQGKEGEGERMIIVTGEARFGEGEIARLKDVLAANIAATRAEDGCLAYSYAVDLEDPNLLHISEQWRDEAAVAHLAIR
jgi:hypothetical protein